MRQHKFRMWDSEKQKMIYGHNDHTDGHAWVFQRYESFKGLMPGRLTLMHATGFEIEGIEAWECDIVSTAFGIGVVAYLPKEASFVIIRKSKILCWLASRCVNSILGNKFENCQLLGCPFPDRTSLKMVIGSRP